MIDPEEKEFEIATGVLEDCRRYIAAHKVQRWDVVKWGVSVNLALAVAAATPALADVRFYLFLLSCGVAAASWLLVRHYNQRVTGIRKQAEIIISWLMQKGVDYDAILGKSTKDAYASRDKLRLARAATIRLDLGCLTGACALERDLPTRQITRKAARSELGDRCRLAPYSPGLDGYSGSTRSRHTGPAPQSTPVPTRPPR